MEPDEIASILCIELARVNRLFNRWVNRLTKNLSKDLKADFEESEGKPSRLNRERISTPEYYEAVNLLLETWKTGNYKYPFSRMEGRGIKYLYRLYGRPTTLALIELFPQVIDDWTRKNIGLNMQGLKHSLAKLLDNPRLKDIARKYETKITIKTEDILLTIGKPVPEKQSAQAAKMASLKALYDDKV